MTLPHHYATHRNQRSRGKTKFFRSKQRGDHYIAAGLQFAVSLHANTAAQVVQQQHLLRLRPNPTPMEYPRA